MQLFPHTSSPISTHKTKTLQKADVKRSALSSLAFEGKRNVGYASDNWIALPKEHTRKYALC
jgi:hypothetical protein